MQTQNQITSIIDQCDFITAFRRVINNFDPNRAKNRKTNILDCSSFFTWNETDYRLYNIIKSRNIDGSVCDTRYDLIIYDPPTNKTFIPNILENSKKFSNIINIGGCVIVKLKDFKIDNELKGCFNLQKIMESNDFYLSDQFIFKHPRKIVTGCKAFLLVPSKIW